MACCAVRAVSARAGARTVPCADAGGLALGHRGRACMAAVSAGFIYGLPLGLARGTPGTFSG